LFILNCLYLIVYTCHEIRALVINGLLKVNLHFYKLEK